MKQSISTPVAVGIIVVVVLIAGFFFWQRMNATPAADTNTAGMGAQPSARGAHMRGTQGTSGGAPTR